MQYRVLSTVCEYRKDRISADEVNENNYISTENMLPNRGGIEIASSVAEGKTFPAYKEGDILLSNIRPYFKKIWFADKKGGCSNDVLVLKANKSIDKRFLYYVLSDNNFFNYSTVTSKGTKMPRGSKTAIMKYLVPDVDMPTQKRIAEILSAYDELIENNNRRIALLEKVAQELYKEWFVRFRFPGYETAKFENGLPEGWMVMRVKDLVKRYPFGTLYKGDSILSEGKTIVIDQSTNEYAGFHNNEPSHIANIDRPIILFGDHTCKYQLMTIPFSLSENVVPFTGAEAVETTYLYYLVNGIVETTEYKRHWTEFVSKKVLVADNKVQRLFRKKIKDSLLLIESLKLQNRNLTKQRDLLLPRLMSGKLEV